MGGMPHDICIITSLNGRRDCAALTPATSPAFRGRRVRAGRTPRGTLSPKHIRFQVCRPNVKVPNYYSEYVQAETGSTLIDLEAKKEDIKAFHVS